MGAKNGDMTEVGNASVSIDPVGGRRTTAGRGRTQVQPTPRGTKFHRDCPGSVRTPGTFERALPAMGPDAATRSRRTRLTAPTEANVTEPTTSQSSTVMASRRGNLG